MTSSPLSSLDLNLLVTLDVLLQERSVSRAARRLGRSQPAVSHALTRLRTALHDPLLIREGNAMVATPRAIALGPGLRKVLGDLQRLLDDAGDFDPATSQRRFVLQCPDMLAPLVPALLAALSDAPAVALELTTTDQPEADLTLGALREAPPGARARRLGTVTQQVAMRPDHPAVDAPWCAETYVRWPHVFVRPPSADRSFVALALEAAGLERRVGLVAPGFLVAAQVVAHTNLFFTAPGALLRHVPETLTLRPPPVSIPEVPVAAHWPERLHSDPGHRWFRECVVGVLLEALKG